MTKHHPTAIVGQHLFDVLEYVCDTATAHDANSVAAIATAIERAANAMSSGAGSANGIELSVTSELKEGGKMVSSVALRML